MKSALSAHIPKMISQVIAVLSIAVGLLVLLGWAFDVSALKSVQPGLATMKANTALAFVLSGVALWLQSGVASSERAFPSSKARRDPAFVWLVRLCATIVALIGLLTFSEYLFGWNLGIDQFLFRDDTLPTPTSHPGRMTPLTAVNFTILGVAFLAMDNRTRGGQRAAQWLVLTVAFGAFLAVLGYAYGVESFYRVYLYSSMALHTALLFLVIPVGFLCARPNGGLIHLATGDDPGGTLIRCLLPTAVLAPPAIGWLLLVGQQAGFYSFRFGLALFAASNVIIFSALVCWTARLVRHVDAERRTTAADLRQSQSRFATLAEFVPQLVWTAEADGRIDYFNQRWYDYTGATPEQTANHGWAQLLHPDDREPTWERWQEGLKTGRPVEREYRLRGADGTYQWFLARGTPLKDEKGQVVKWFGSCTNVDRQHRAEQALRASEARKGAVIESAIDCIIVADRDGRITEFNPAAEAAFGYRCADVMGKELAETIVPPRFRDAHRQGIRRYLETGEGRVLGKRLEMTAVRADGSEIPVELGITAIQVGGQPVFTAHLRDITERQRLEARFHATVESAPMAMVMVDASGAIVLVNAQTEKLFGYPRQELLGQSVDVLVPARFRGGHARLRTQFCAAPEARRMGAGRDLYGLRRDGSEFPVEIGLSPIETAEGLFVLSAIVDITERKVAEENLRRAHDALETRVRERTTELTASLQALQKEMTERQQAEAEKRALEAQIQHAQKLESLGVLAGGIAHDFNNLLTSILGYADLAMRELPPGSSARKLIGEVVNGARRAAELTMQMLAYSGKGRFVVKPLNLSQLIAEMARLLHVSISKKCALKFDYLPDLPAIEADESQMRQIVMNLIINASDAIGDRSGVIAVATGVLYCDRAYLSTTYAEENLPEGLYVSLEVADSGCGMTEETKAKIFDPFFTTKFTGRGLGLSAVLGIVRGHRGAIKVYSELEKGTTFKVIFPATTLPVVKTDERRAEGDKEWRGSGVVLVVDDEESVRGMARYSLQTMGFTVLTAANGLEAVELFRRECDRIRLVLLDMTMPHLDGEQTFRELRRIRGDIRTILCSGYNEQSATSRFAGKGLAAFIQKPYSFDTLVAVVRKTLEG